MQTLRTTTLAAGDALIVRVAGADYSHTDIAVTVRTADNVIPEAATGGDATAMTVDTTVEGGRVVSCVVMMFVLSILLALGSPWWQHRCLHRLCN